GALLAGARRDRRREEGRVRLAAGNDGGAQRPLPRRQAQRVAAVAADRVGAAIGPGVDVHRYHLGAAGRRRFRQLPRRPLPRPAPITAAPPGADGTMISPTASVPTIPTAERVPRVIPPTYRASGRAGEDF